jgi:hypothetical protein
MISLYLFAFVCCYLFWLFSSNMVFDHVAKGFWFMFVKVTAGSCLWRLRFTNLIWSRATFRLITLSRLVKNIGMQSPHGIGSILVCSTTVAQLGCCQISQHEVHTKKIMKPWWDWWDLCLICDATMDPFHIH